MTYDGANGEVSSFELDVTGSGTDEVFSIANPTPTMTKNLQRWKDGETEIEIEIEDRDGDCEIESGDKISE